MRGNRFAKVDAFELAGSVVDGAGRRADVRDVRGQVQDVEGN